jgi:DNA polymerase III gamma/tau subunit
MKISMIMHPNIVGEHGIKKVLQVPTRPRTKLVRNKKIRRSCLASFIKSLGLTQEELNEKIRKLKYSRDYSFLFSDDHEQAEKIKPYFRREKVEAFGHNKKLKVGSQNCSQEYVHHVKQSHNRKSERKKVEDFNHNYKASFQANHTYKVTKKCLPKIAHHRKHEMPCKYRRVREARVELGHIREMF